MPLKGKEMRAETVAILVDGGFYQRMAKRIGGEKSAEGREKGREIEKRGAFEKAPL